MQHMHDLYFQYLGTDEYGIDNFQRYHIDDRLTMKKPLGTVRLNPTEKEQSTLEQDLRRDYNITCKCPRCL